ncbi:MAG TPA: [protein-PII] uridylyltransferase [Thermodesulfobacteriota bacterium]|nr:[protein-PII] uridylyltransferase [Thermodesulfobacteriota bacterium]
MAKVISSKQTETGFDLSKYYVEHFEHIKKLHRLKAGNLNKLSGRSLAKRRSKAMDDLIINYLSYGGFTNLKNLSVIALGGYGRSDLSPHSDIDILFLYDDIFIKTAKEITQSLLYKLWDLKLDVGYATRTVDECVELSFDKDTTILTSMLDSRLIYGDESLFKSLNNKLFKQVLPKNSKTFIENKVSENLQRIEKYGNSIYMLEPNVKESVGGLRDIHFALWIAQAKFKVKTFKELLLKGILFHNELNTLNKNMDFLLSIRAELHYLAGKAEDRIRFEYGEDIAKYLGFKDSDLRAVEKFMRIYYLRANQTREVSKRLIDRCLVKPQISSKFSKITKLGDGFILQGGKLSVTHRKIIEDQPPNMIRAFVISDKFGCNKTPYLADLIKDNSNLKTITDKFRTNEEVNQYFLKLLKDGKQVSKELFEMNRLRFLGRFIPEFGKIVCMAQYDAYHVYTVDIHSIFMIEEIERLINGQLEDKFPLLTNLAREVQRKDILYLGCLFHDMGKGEGKNHSQKGAAMIPKIAKRMSLESEDADVLEFMVKHHLIMPHFSQRRDLNDESLIQRFAKSVKTKQTLDLLYLLTFADIRSVGPDTWSDWKGMLLQDLYLKTAAILEQSEYRKEEPHELRQRYIKEVSNILKDSIKEKTVAKILKEMPDSYFKGFSPKRVATHVKLIERAGKDTDFHISYHPPVKFDDFIFWGEDTTGIFHKLCGVLAANGLNILGARITSTSRKRILDVFYVNRMGESTIDDKQIWTKVRSDLEKVLSGELKAKQLLEKKILNYAHYRKNIPTHPTKVEIDNESSDDFTIIEYYSNDRIGLLYEVSRELSNLGYSIEYAKISTKVDQVSDVFYITDSNNKKILSSKKLREIKDTLLSLDS